MRCHPQQTVDAWLADGRWSTDTIDGLLRTRVATEPDRLALVDPPNTGELIGADPLRLTWSELDTRVDDVAGTLLAAGASPGSVVAVQLPNCSALVVTLLAVVRIGAISTPFPVSYREHEIERMCARSGAVLAVSTAATAERFAGVAARTLVWGSDIGTGAAEGIEVGVHTADVNDCVTICWTSGTEAEPKAVPRCHGDWLVLAEATRHSAALGGDDVLLSPFPMINMAGISGMFLPWLLGGGVFVPHQPFDLQVFLRQIATERATYTVAPPALLTMLLHNEALLSAVDISSLRLIGAGSAPLAGWVVREWAQRHGVEIINFFGSNEGVGMTSDLADVPEPEHRASYFPNYSAKNSNWRNPIAGKLSIRIVDEASGEPLTEPGAVGELRIAGPNVFAGYLGDGTGAPLDGSAFDEHGYFRSGDIFELAGEHGEFLRYVDRAKDLVIRGGMNISPAAVEALIGAHPSVADVAVIGVADEVLGERVCAVIVPKGEPPTLAEVVEFLREQQIASYQLPERLELIEALPRNPVGKVLKRSLREQFDPATAR